MTMALFKSYNTNLLSLFGELHRVDLKLKDKAAEARNRDKYWQNNSIRGLFISEAEISDLLSRPLDEKLVCRTDDHSDVRDKASDSSSIQEREISRLDFLVQEFNFSGFEKDLVLLAILPELDLIYERLFGYIQDDVTRRKPSVGLALDLLSSTPAEKITNRKAFSTDSALIRHHIIEIQEEINRKNSPLLSKSIKLDERIRDYILGLDLPDTNLIPYTTLVKPTRDLGQIIVQTSTRINLQNLIRDDGKRQSALLYFWGARGSGKRSIVDALCRKLGTRYLKVDVPAMLSSSISFDLARVLLFREAALQQVPVFLHDFDSLFVNEHISDLNSITSNLDREYLCPGPLFASGTVPWKSQFKWTNRIFIPVELSIPGYEDRRQIWQSYLTTYNLRDTSLAVGLSSKFKMNIGQIDRCVDMAHYKALYSNGGQIKGEDLYDACRQVSSYKLSELAQKINAHYRWDDIVLPVDQIAQLKEICNQVKFRHVVYNDWGFERKISLGKGLNALFAGPSGTGKTMSAEIIANELKLDLYKIDLSSVVSKYIGETEKNLNHIFKEAQDSNSILFFDEADSLFGKRSEVRDSHDRYANIEIAYLLQKMEEYEGIVILATNLGKNIDEAFARRMHFAIEFPFPDEEQRLQIWQKVFPANAPLDKKTDLRFMSKQFRISGGNIKNIAVAAAFFAAADNSNILMNHIILATKREYQKIGKLCTASEFGEYF